MTGFWYTCVHVNESPLHMPITVISYFPFEIDFECMVYTLEVFKSLLDIWMIMLFWMQQ